MLSVRGGCWDVLQLRSCIVFTDKGELVLTVIENEEHDTDTILNLKIGKELTINEVTKYLNVSPETLMKAIISTPTIYDDKKH